MRLSRDESMSDDVQPFARMFLVDSIGIVLRSSRWTNDDHVLFEVISEDDGYWSKGDRKSVV